MSIINNTDYTFQPIEQQLIQNAMANAGIDQVYTQRVSAKPVDKYLFHFYEDKDFKNYAFSIDTDAECGCEIWNKQ
jgi:hypothetical protein